MIFTEPPCNTCRHWIPAKGKTICKAFSERIPDEIFFGNNKHTQPLPGQKNDIVFEKIKEE
jgi:hypothetical protein